MNVVRIVCNRIVVPRPGEAMEAGPRRTVFERQWYGYTQALLDAILRARPHCRSVAVAD